MSSFPLQELTARLSPRTATLGRVVSSSGAQLVCATPDGRRVAMAGQGVGVGDRVVIRDGVAYRAPSVALEVAV